MSALDVRGVTLVRSRRTLLDDVTLEVAAGEFLALVGPNGAGKSTLLSVLAGDLAPDRGEVLIQDLAVSQIRSRDLARRRAVLPQRSTLAFGFSARDVVTMGRTPWHRTPRAAHDERIVEAALTSTHTGEFADRQFPTLSGGEQGRIGFARVLAQETPILLLDEPTAALDLRHQEHLLTTAQQAAKRGAAVVIVLHDLASAAAYSDRICLLHQGRISGIGTPDEVLTESRLEHVYDHPVDVVRHGHRLLVVPRTAA